MILPSLYLDDGSFLSVKNCCSSSTTSSSAAVLFQLSPTRTLFPASWALLLSTNWQSIFHFLRLPSSFLWRYEFLNSCWHFQKGTLFCWFFDLPNSQFWALSKFYLLLWEYSQSFYSPEQLIFDQQAWLYFCWGVIVVLAPLSCFTIQAWVALLSSQHLMVAGERAAILVIEYFIAFAFPVASFSSTPKLPCEGHIFAFFKVYFSQQL